MRLDEIGMIAADTTRSRAYLQALVRNKLLPSYVLVLGNFSDRPLPGQLDKMQSGPATVQLLETDECWSEAHFNPNEPINVTLSQFNIPHEISTSNNINDAAVVGNINRRKESVFIYSGFGGVLLRNDILRTGKHFLHVHGGYLPDYKGSTTNYYSLIAENALGASSLFLSEEIDSGAVLLRRRFAPPANRQEIDHVYDSGARAKVLVETLQNYLQSGSWNFELPANAEGETYYIIHPILKHIAILTKREGLQCE